ncbi:MAG: M20/M25/M40 family metallo-hydrolase [Solirubrobacterales bacterium]
MDEAGRIELIRELCSFERRGPGTDAERRAANMLAGRLRASGRRAETEPTYVRPPYALVHALHAAIAIAGSVLATVEPAIGFGLVFAAATSIYLDLNTRFYLVRRLFFRRASQNVVSPGPNPDAPLRVILSAHYDAARTGFVFGERSHRLASRLSPRMRILLGPFRLIFWGGIAPLLPILGARMAGVDAQWLSVLQLIPTVVLIVAVFLLIDIALSEIVPGAYDNASGVAAVLSAAAALDADRPPNVDLWVVLAGAEESNCEGMREFVRAHKRELDEERTVFVIVDGASWGEVHYETSEGAIASLNLDPELIELCEALDAAGDRARPVRSPLLTDALPPRVRGYRAISIASLTDGLVPPWYHTPEDTPDRLVPASLERTTDFVVSLIRLLDRGAGRAAR